MQHRKQQVADAGVAIDGAGTDLVVLLGVGDVVFGDLRQVEINVCAVLVAKRFAASEDGGKVGVAVAVTVGHAAAPEDLRGIEQGCVAFLVLFELVEEIAELADEEGIRLGETAELLGVAVVVAEAVAGLQNTDLGDAAGVAFAADAAGDDAGGIRAQRHDHEVVEQAIVLARFGHAQFALKTGGFVGCDDGLGDVQPFIGAAGAYFDLTHGGQVFVELAAILAAELVVHAIGVIGHDVEDAATAAETATNGLLAVFFDSEQGIEYLLCIALGRKLDAILGPRKRSAFDSHLE